MIRLTRRDRLVAASMRPRHKAAENVPEEWPAEAMEEALQ